MGCDILSCTLCGLGDTLETSDRSTVEMNVVKVVVVVVTVVTVVVAVV